MKLYSRIYCAVLRSASNRVHIPRAHDALDLYWSINIQLDCCCIELVHRDCIRDVMQKVFVFKADVRLRQSNNPHRRCSPNTCDLSLPGANTPHHLHRGWSRHQPHTASRFALNLIISLSSWLPWALPSFGSVRPKWGSENPVLQAELELWLLISLPAAPDRQVRRQTWERLWCWCGSSSGTSVHRGDTRLKTLQSEKKQFIF